MIRSLISHCERTCISASWESRGSTPPRVFRAFYFWTCVCSPSEAQNINHFYLTLSHITPRWTLSDVGNCNSLDNVLCVFLVRCVCVMSVRHVVRIWCPGEGRLKEMRKRGGRTADQRGGMDEYEAEQDWQDVILFTRQCLAHKVTCASFLEEPTDCCRLPVRVSPTE